MFVYVIKTMIKKLSAQIFTGLVSLTLIINQAPSFANPSSAKQNSPNQLYEKPKAELPDDYFAVYVIVDRIARANSLDDKPWRIVISPSNEVNAYASDINVLTFNKGLLKHIEGDSSALACVIGHEMGHHVEQHLGYGPALQNEAALNELKKAEQEKLIAEQDAEIQNKLAQLAAGTGTAIGGEVGGTAGQLIQIGAAIFGGTAQTSQAEIEEIKRRIDAEAEERFKKRVIEISHQHEFEADKKGYLYSVKAGFESDGCINVLKVLGRMPGAQTPSKTHPTPEKRIEKIQELKAQYPPQTLKTEGEKLLNQKNNSLLNYEVFTEQLPDNLSYSGLKVFPITGTTEDDLCRIVGC